jgi:hypothetical protein
MTFLSHLYVLGLFLMLGDFTFAYQGPTFPSQRSTARQQQTSLSAWSLSTMTGQFSAPTWYNEYNPTARTTVYNE